MPVVYDAAIILEEYITEYKNTFKLITRRLHCTTWFTFFFDLLFLFSLQWTQHSAHHMFTFTNSKQLMNISSDVYSADCVLPLPLVLQEVSRRRQIMWVLDTGAEWNLT